ncbi:MarR family winged helix-turn-helix transcriptional regulator [Nocardioides pocheonensis]|uniref:MarR family transcriptional regulator n=1 Tax=Nocardioides pocheonensis TaxID=661485 RepID=A0A3N0GN64_9ACTN|nr:MarR family transcriptional regulator [Nocardioides pocheonensis]RNM13811.1 MarR family transcriptional regulator [Nocardioides pocheonensis]
MTTPPPDDVGGDTIRLYRALVRITRSIRRDAREIPIGHGALSALATLVTDGPQRAGTLAETEGVSAPAMTRLLKFLEDQAYVARRADPDDGRATLLAATQAGEDLVRSGRAARLRGLEDRLAALPDDQLELLLAALPALEALADDA